MARQVSKALLNSFLLLISLFLIYQDKNHLVLAQSVQKPEKSPDCSLPVLSRLQKHKIAKGETIETIARKYNLSPSTLIQLNPNLQGSSIPVGQEILIPPFNGIRVQVPTGATWVDLEKAYGVRSDVLFEVNGCQQKPTVVFIPGIDWSPEQRYRDNNYTGFPGYPLPSIAKVGLSYGWHQDANKQNMFHSGIDLLAILGTPVLGVDKGQVVFVGQQGNYGNLIVINHEGGRQTRYAHLATAQVKIGQDVNIGDVLGTVGNSGRPDLPEPHLHFEVRYNTPLGWVAQDPSIHLPTKVGR